MVTSVLEQFWCPDLVKIYSILSKVQDLLHNLYLVLGFRPNDVKSYSVMEFCKYLTWWRINVSGILSDALYLQNKNYFYINEGWFCWYMLPKNMTVIIGKQMLNILKNLVFESWAVMKEQPIIRTKHSRVWANFYVQFLRKTASKYPVFFFLWKRYYGNNAIL